MMKMFRRLTAAAIGAAMVFSMQICAWAAGDMFDPAFVAEKFNENIPGFIQILTDGKDTGESYVASMGVSRNADNDYEDQSVCYSTASGGYQMIFSNDGRSLTCIVDLNAAEANLPDLILGFMVIMEMDEDSGFMSWINDQSEKGMIYDGRHFTAIRAEIPRDIIVTTYLKK